MRHFCTVLLDLLEDNSVNKWYTSCPIYNLSGVFYTSKLRQLALTVGVLMSPGTQIVKSNVIRCVHNDQWIVLANLVDRIQIRIKHYRSILKYRTKHCMHEKLKSLYTIDY